MQSDRRVALIIGCAAYSVGPLDNPVRDATALEACFKRLGFDEVMLVTNPKLAQLGRKLADFAVAAENAEMAAIYFAGHGIEASGNTYLIPCDAELGDARRLDFEAIKLADIMRTIDNPRRHLRLIILDACRNNPYRGRMRGLDVRRSGEGGLGYVEPRGNMLVAYAAEHGRTALDGDLGGHSPYAKALLAHLETPNLEIRLLFGRVRDDVFRHTKEDQAPHLYGTLGGQEIYLKRDRTAMSHPPEPVTLPSQSEPLRSLANQLWEEFKISSTTDLELIQAYIAQMERDGEALAVYKARKRLDEVAAQLQADDDADWQAAERTDTIESYQFYLKSWPSGRQAEKAYLRIQELDDAAAWNEVRLSEDATKLQSFISRYQKSIHVRDAKDQIGKLEEVAAWNVARTTEDIVLVRHFLSRYTDGPHATGAKQLLQRLVSNRQVNGPSFVAAIYRADGTIAGTGFAIRNGYVITCAHVVREAIGSSGPASEREAAPSQPMMLKFRFIEGHPNFEATVVPGGWFPGDAKNYDVGPLRDIAVLAPSSPSAHFPPGPEMLALSWHGGAVCIGFPGNRYGLQRELRGHVAEYEETDGWLNFHPTHNLEKAEIGGMSGAPVLRDGVNAVAAMLSGKWHDDEPFIRVIPATIISAVVAQVEAARSALKAAVSSGTHSERRSGID